MPSKYRIILAIWIFLQSAYAGKWLMNHAELTVKLGNNALESKAPDAWTASAVWGHSTQMYYIAIVVVAFVGSALLAFALCWGREGED